MKSKEKLNEIKKEVETTSKKLRKLTEEELAQVTGGKENAGGSETSVAMKVEVESDSTGLK